jgi:ABC-type nitrate/sulfonate/bicarbonate transport system permease component
MFSGLKVAVGLCDRLGHLYWKSNLAFGAMLLLAVMAVGLFALVEAVERVVCPWYSLSGEGARR